MKEKSLAMAKSWTENTYFDAKDRQEIERLILENNDEEILERFSKDLEFGTGGMRSILGMGRSRMNKYNVRKASEAMARAAIEKQGSKLKAVVSYDNRFYSFEFAKEVARVFAGHNIKTFIFPALTPTPILSFAIRHLKANLGVMVTASHNPKDYNGYKAYWSDGAQLTPPHDELVIQKFQEVESFDLIKLADFDSALESGLVEFIDSEVFESFYRGIEEQSPRLSICKDQGHKLKAIYTSLHGTGLLPCKEISLRMGFTNFETIKEQETFDSSFSTVKTTPNPEDPVALELAVAKMLKNNAHVAYGTDPDCDRLGVVVNHEGEPHYLNGNQIAILMLEYLFSSMHENNSLPANPLVLKSIVTSNLQRDIVSHFGGTVMDTLTGFKWMAKLLKELENTDQKFDFIFASEESFGYMPNKEVRDKDAVASIALMNELTLYNLLEGKTLIDKLDEIYTTYGFALDGLLSKTYEGMAGKRKINNIMEHFRHHSFENVGKEKLRYFTDFLTGEKRDSFSNTVSKIDFTRSNVLAFHFDSGDALFLRPSGTEPKIKFYFMVSVSEGSLPEMKVQAKSKIESMQAFVEREIEEL